MCSLGRQPFVASRVAFFRLKVAAACKSKTRGWARSVRVGTPSHLHGGLVVASEHEEGCLVAVCCGEGLRLRDSAAADGEAHKEVQLDATR